MTSRSDHGLGACSGGLRALFDAYLRHYPEEADSLQALAAQLAAETAIFHRRTLPGHVTASGIVLRGNALLLVLHPHLGRWLQPGGHVDPGETPAAASIREVREESGINTLLHPTHGGAGIPLDIDIHSIPANPRKGEPEHLHYDFRYLLVEDPGGVPQAHPAELPFSWVDAAELSEPNLMRVARKLQPLAQQGLRQESSLHSWSGTPHGQGG